MSLGSSTPFDGRGHEDPRERDEIGLVTEVDLDPVDVGGRAHGTGAEPALERPLGARGLVRHGRARHVLDGVIGALQHDAHAVELSDSSGVAEELATLRVRLKRDLGGRGAAHHRDQNDRRREQGAHATRNPRLLN